MKFLSRNKLFSENFIVVCSARLKRLGNTSLVILFKKDHRFLRSFILVDGANLFLVKYVIFQAALSSIRINCQLDILQSKPYLSISCQKLVTVTDSSDATTSLFFVFVSLSTSLYYLCIFSLFLSLSP